MTSATRRGTFSRSLAPAFIGQLSHGAFRPLMDAVRASDLDVEVRQDYINIYDGRNSILKLEYRARQNEFRASIHRKYGPPAGFVTKAEDVYAVQWFSLTEAPEWTQRFVNEVPELRRKCLPYNKPEGGAEFRLVHANRNPPFLVLDRQVQLSQLRDSRVDILGLSVEGKHESVVLVELKHGTRLKAADVLQQVDRYRTYYEESGVLRSDVADRLDAVLALKRDLGLIHGQCSRPLRELPIEYLVVQVTPGAAIPSPPKVIAGTRRVYFLGRTMADLRVSERASWQILRGP